MPPNSGLLPSASIGPECAARGWHAANAKTTDNTIASRRLMKCEPGESAAGAIAPGVPARAIDRWQQRLMRFQ
ncbi:MAG TPA: hypothetical protein VIK18_26085 [Pirellulales bacterium]